VREAGRRALVLQADVSEAAACDEAMRAIDREFGRLDVLVNMASLYQAVPDERSGRVDCQLRDLAIVSRESPAVPLMRRSGGGRIVNH
jgi:3-oxoacyl-[acyl-carrier protein] reductase